LVVRLLRKDRSATLTEKNAPPAESFLLCADECELHHDAVLFRYSGHGNLVFPGVKPEYLAKEAIRRLDDKTTLDDAVADGLPSITAMNGNKQPGAAGGGDPNAQGPQGANNNPAAPTARPDAPTPPPNPATAASSGLPN